MVDNNNILKQAKNDIFLALEGIIKFYIIKGASYKALKKYYKKKKNFEELLDDIKNKSINIFNSEKEYKSFVSKILTELFDDRIAHEADNEKLKTFEKFLSSKEEM